MNRPPDAQISIADVEAALKERGARNRALGAAELLLADLERGAEAYGMRRYTIESYIGPDQVQIIHRVEIRRAGTNLLNYFDTDGWGNLMWSTRDQVLSRLAEAMRS